MLPGTPKPASIQSPNYFGNGGNIAKGPVGLGGGLGMEIGTNAMTPQLPQSQPQVQRQPAHFGTQEATQPPTATSSGQVQGKDPFADLAGLF